MSVVLKMEYLALQCSNAPKDADEIANCVDTDKNALLESDLGLHCLLRPI